MWRQGSKAVKPVTKEQITAEIKYQASIAPFRLMLKNGQISTEDYRVIDTILTENTFLFSFNLFLRIDWIYFKIRVNMSDTKGGIQ